MKILLKELVEIVEAPLLEKKKLKQAGKVEYKSFKSGDSLDAAMNIFIHLHQKRWISQGLPGSFARKKFQQFHKKIAEIFADKNWLSMDFLLLNGKEKACIYGYKYNKKFYYYLTGLDLVKEKLSLGVNLLSYSIQKAITDKCLEYDFLRGDERYKYSWTNLDRRNLQIIFYNRNLRGLLFLFIVYVKNFLKVILR